MLFIANLSNIHKGKTNIYFSFVPVGTFLFRLPILIPQINLRAIFICPASRACFSKQYYLINVPIGTIENSTDIHIGEFEITNKIRVPQGTNDDYIFTHLKIFQIIAYINKLLNYSFPAISLERRSR